MIVSFKRAILLVVMLSILHPVAAKGADAISSDLFAPVAAAIDRLTAEVTRAADALEEIVAALTVGDTHDDGARMGGNAAGVDGLRSNQGGG